MGVLPRSELEVPSSTHLKKIASLHLHQNKPQTLDSAIVSFIVQLTLLQFILSICALTHLQGKRSHDEKSSPTQATAIVTGLSLLTVKYVNLQCLNLTGQYKVKSRLLETGIFRSHYHLPRQSLQGPPQRCVYTIRLGHCYG